MSEPGKRRLEYDECVYCLATGEIQAGFLRRFLFGVESYTCPICNGTGKHVDEWQLRRPNVWVSNDGPNTPEATHE